MNNNNDNNNSDRGVGGIDAGGGKSGSAATRPDDAVARSVARRVVITMYRSGFTVDDGPYRRLDDPDNKEFLWALASGRTPRELTDDPDAVEVGLDDRRTEDYVARVVESDFSGEDAKAVDEDGGTELAVKPLPRFTPNRLFVASSPLVVALLTSLIVFLTMKGSSTTKWCTTILWRQDGVNNTDGKSIRDDAGSSSVALSNDGDRLLVGGDGRLQLYVFDGDVWETDLDLSAWISNDLVRSVSVSADGRALVAGQPERINSTGAVLVFQEEDSSWSQSGRTLEGEQEGDAFGASVAVNGNGTVIVVGAATHNNYYFSGSNVYGGEYVKVFVRKNDRWDCRDRIEGYSGSGFGVSISLSSEGKRLIVGAHNASNNLENSGSMYLYALFPRSELQRMDGDRYRSHFGDDVSISSDGSVVVGTSSGLSLGAAHWKEGMPYLDGSAKVFRAVDESLERYQQIGDVIVGNWSFGYSASLSSNGDRLVVGGYSEVFVYDIDDDDHRFVGTLDRGYFVYWSVSRVSMSGDGSRVAVGVENDIGQVGQVRVYESFT